MYFLDCIAAPMGATPGPLPDKLIPRSANGLPPR